MSYENNEQRLVPSIPTSKQINLVEFELATEAPVGRRRKWGLGTVATKVAETGLFHYNLNFDTQEVAAVSAHYAVPTDLLRPSYHLLVDRTQEFPQFLVRPKIVEAYRLMGYNPDDSKVYMKSVELESSPALKDVFEVELGSYLIYISTSPKVSKDENKRVLEDFLNAPYLVRERLHSH